MKKKPKWCVLSSSHFGTQFQLHVFLSLVVSMRFVIFQQPQFSHSIILLHWITKTMLWNMAQSQKWSVTIYRVVQWSLSLVNDLDCNHHPLVCHWVLHKVAWIFHANFCLPFHTFCSSHANGRRKFILWHVHWDMIMFCAYKQGLKNTALSEWSIFHSYRIISASVDSFSAL